MNSHDFKGKTTDQELHYKTDFSCHQFETAQKQLWDDAHTLNVTNPLVSEWEGELHLPQPNPFIPADFSLRCENEASLHGSEAGSEVEASATRSLTHVAPVMIVRNQSELRVSVVEEHTSSEEEEVAAGAAPSTSTDCAGGGSGSGDENPEHDNQDEDEEVDASNATNEMIPVPLFEANQRLVVWYKQDFYWKVPKANVIISLETLLVQTRITSNIGLFS